MLQYFYNFKLNQLLLIIIVSFWYYFYTNLFVQIFIDLFLFLIFSNRIYFSLKHLQRIFTIYTKDESGVYKEKSTTGLN
jgi:hypothetical protein